MVATAPSSDSALLDVAERLDACVSQVARFAPATVAAITSAAQLAGQLGSPHGDGSALDDDRRLLVEVEHAARVHGQLLIRIEDALERHARIAERLDEQRLVRYAERLAGRAAPLAQELAGIVKGHQQLADRWQQVKLVTRDAQQGRILFLQLVREADEMRQAVSAYASEIMLATQQLREPQPKAEQGPPPRPRLQPLGGGDLVDPIGGLPARPLES